VLVKIFVDSLQLLLELLDVLLGMWVHLIKDQLSPLKCLDLIRIPLAGRLFELDLSLDDVKLLLQLFKLSIVDLKRKERYR
jgi:hypothetical protein